MFVLQQFESLNDILVEEGDNAEDVAKHPEDDGDAGEVARDDNLGVCQQDAAGAVFIFWNSTDRTDII